MYGKHFDYRTQKSKRDQSNWLVQIVDLVIVRRFRRPKTSYCRSRLSICTSYMVTLYICTMYLPRIGSVNGPSYDRQRLKKNEHDQLVGEFIETVEITV